jgi:hypothetical protein
MESHKGLVYSMKRFFLGNENNYFDFDVFSWLLQIYSGLETIILIVVLLNINKLIKFE